VGHLLFQTLIDRTGDCAGATMGAAGTVIIGEVVLFEHLLWMVENAGSQPESLNELIDYYVC
jgi:hypothetical protein